MASGFPFNLLTGPARRAGNGNEQTARGTQWGSQAVAQFEQPLTELTRAGARFGGGLQIIANAFASVQAIPTTGGSYLLYNGNATKSLVIDSAVHWLASGTADVGSLLMGAVSPLRIASAPTAHPTGWGVSSLSGSGRTSGALWQATPTISAGAAWLGLAGNTQAAATTAGSGGGPFYSAGGIIVPPYFGLSLTVLSGVGTSAKYGVSLTWAEIELDLE